MINLNRYICFNLGEEEFTIPLLSVKEVIGVPEVTPVPQTPNYFLGIMNLRGSVISIMDLRLKVGLPANNSEETTVIILDLGDYNLGVVVDKVNTVMVADEKSFSEKPPYTTSKVSDSITGIFRKDDHLILVLDIAKALSVEDHSALARSMELQKKAG